MSSNDNDPDPRTTVSRSPDPHGQAALILVETLLHGLVERSVITARDSIDIVTGAVEVQADYADDAGPSGRAMRHAQTLLTTIAASLSHDA